MKIKRREVGNMLDHILIQDSNGAQYTDKVRGAITALDFHLSTKLKENQEFHKKVEAEGVKALKITEDPETRPEEEKKKLIEYIDKHAEFNKYLDTNIVIPVQPIKLEDLSKCRYMPSVFRSWYGTVIVS